MNVNAAGCLGQAGLRRVDDGDVLGTTALAVDHIGAGLAAAGPLLAGRAVRHAVMELKVAVELGLDVHAGQRERSDVLTATERGALVLRVAANTGDHVAA